MARLSSLLLASLVLVACALANAETPDLRLEAQQELRLEAQQEGAQVIEIEPTCELTAAAKAFIQAERAMLEERLREPSHHIAHRAVMSYQLGALDVFDQQLSGWRTKNGCLGPKPA